MRRTYYVEAIEAEMLDISTLADRDDGRYAVGITRVLLRSRAGVFGVPWPIDSLPSIGDRVHVTIDVEQ